MAKAANFDSLAILLHNKETRHTVTWADFEYDVDFHLLIEVLKQRYL